MLLMQGDQRLQLSTAFWYLQLFYSFFTKSAAFYSLLAKSTVSLQLFYSFLTSTAFFVQILNSQTLKKCMYYAFSVQHTYNIWWYMIPYVFFMSNWCISSFFTYLIKQRENFTQFCREWELTRKFHAVLSRMRINAKILRIFAENEN